MKSLEIFSGAGGLAKGLEQAGFDHAAFIELNRDACNSLRSNFDPTLVFEGDVATFDFGALNGVDLVAGGPPCQPFSVAGKHRANLDQRDMFPYAITAIRVLRPKAFVFENVKGLLRQSFKEYFDYIILRLAFPDLQAANDELWTEHLYRLRKHREARPTSQEYRVSFTLLNAADFGVPQTRERVVIVGVRSDIPRVWEFPIRTHSKDRLNWDKFVTGEYWDKHCLRRQDNIAIRQALHQKYGMFEPASKPWKTVRDQIGDLPLPETQHILEDHVFKDGARIYPGHTGSFIDDPAKTIKAGGHGVPGGENMIRFEDGSVRYFTVHEGKLIQTFPSDYVVKGAWGEAMRQIGNAVPVKLSEALGVALRDQIFASQVSIAA